MFLSSYKEVREQLEQSQNPLYLYDNDADGLCSYVLLRRWLGRGEGVAVRSYPDVSSQYLEHIDRAHVDCVIVLDRHSLSLNLIDGVKERGIPIVWIDHHEYADTTMQKDSDFIYYFNPRYTPKKKNAWPVSFHALQVAKVKKDSWIALVGCISDAYLPPFAKEVVKEHPSLWKKGIKSAFDAYYNTDFGKIALYINFALKDAVINVIKAQNFMIKCRGPEDIISGGEENALLQERSSIMMKRYITLVQEAKANTNEKVIFFTYSGIVSMSSEISNALMYEFPEKYIAVAFKKGGIVNVSLRGKNVKLMLDNILKKIENSTGGGHADAVGARIPASSLKRFEDLLKEEASGFK